MSVWTRGHLPARDAGSGLTVPHAEGWRQRLIIRGGAPAVVLPPPVVMHDPSDPATWTVPVRWT